MCSIIGAALWDLDRIGNREFANKCLNVLFSKSHARGRDGRGFYTVHTNNDYDNEFKSIATEVEADWEYMEFISESGDSATVVGNLRAEPTTEYVKHKHRDDQQPYSLGNWHVVHNGTIANDKDIRTWRYTSKIDSAAIVEVLNDQHNCEYPSSVFEQAVRKLKGSYAILASRDQNPGRIFAAANYRPIWYILTSVGYFFASSRHFFHSFDAVPQMLEPYTVACFDKSGVYKTKLLNDNVKERALVVCSGGLDSTVAAAQMKAAGFEIELIHFQYGSRAEGPEVLAVKEVAKALGAKLTLFPLSVYDKSDSPLLREDSTIAGGEAGAEFAHEWVPARNLVLLSVAVAYAEAKGFSHVVLGNNLEEAGAYPDNEPEFIDRFNDLLPFAVGDGKKVRITMPVGNMMKHEIVALGMDLGAPLDKTWSCYRAGKLHCGTCGPCFMRRTAFKINGIPEVIQYKDEQ